MAEWVQKGLHTVASQSTKDNDDEILSKIIDKLNKLTESRAKRIVHYRGGSATASIPGSNKKVSYTAPKDKNGKPKYRPTKEIFKVEECMLLMKEQKEKKKEKGKRAPWMEIAIQEGIKYKNCDENQEPLKSKVKIYHKDGGGLTAGSKTAWCASFVNWCIKETGQYSYRKTAGSVSISYYSEYKKIDKPIFGALVVFKNYKKSNNSACSHGHVSFLFGMTKDEKLICLGGNQGNRIKFSLYKKNGITGSFKCMENCGYVNQKFLGFYVPKDYEIKESDYLTDYDIYDQSIDTLNSKILESKAQTHENESNR